MSSAKAFMLCVACVCAAFQTATAEEEMVYLRAFGICDFSDPRYKVVPRKDGGSQGREVITVPKANVIGLEKLAGPDADRCYVMRVRPYESPARYEVRVPSKKVPRAN